MLKDHAKIMYAIAHVGEITGRKKLQKIIFIAKKLDFPFHEKFNFHFYGPYSEELSLRIEELINLEFIHEEKTDRGGYIEYRYSLTEAGKEFLKMTKVEMAQLPLCLTLLNKENARFLELVSTILYFDTLAREEVEEKVSTLKSKQRYTTEEIADAYAYIHTLEKTAHAQS